MEIHQVFLEHHKQMIKDINNDYQGLILQLKQGLQKQIFDLFGQFEHIVFFKEDTDQIQKVHRGNEQVKHYMVNQLDINNEYKKVKQMVEFLKNFKKDVSEAIDQTFQKTKNDMGPKFKNSLESLKAKEVSLKLQGRDSTDQTLDKNSNKQGKSIFKSFDVSCKNPVREKMNEALIKIMSSKIKGHTRVWLQDSKKLQIQKLSNKYCTLSKAMELSQEEIINILNLLASTIAELHNLNIYSGNLNPQNIFIRRQAGDIKLKIGLIYFWRKIYKEAFRSQKEHIDLIIIKNNLEDDEIFTYGNSYLADIFSFIQIFRFLINPNHPKNQNQVKPEEFKILRDLLIKLENLQKNQQINGMDMICVEIQQIKNREFYAESWKPSNHQLKPLQKLECDIHPKRLIKYVINNQFKCFECIVEETKAEEQRIQTIVNHQKNNLQKYKDLFAHSAKLPGQQSKQNQPQLNQKSRS